VGKRSGSRIILTGFSASGKSETGAILAGWLGWKWLDIDEEIVRQTGKSIDHIFAQDGEGYFRQIERQTLLAACEQQQVVISAGGGAVVDPANRESMRGSGFVVCLEAAPETIYNRLLAQDSGPVRPLLSDPDPLRRIRQLKEGRQSYYADADWTVHTDNLSLEEVCREVLRGWYYWRRTQDWDGCAERTGDVACQVVTATEQYPVLVGWGLVGSLGERIKQAGLEGTAHVLSDETVFSLYGERVIASLEGAGLRVDRCVVPPGEGTKTLDTAASLYDWLVERRAERSDCVVALGGGMIGDLAGFVAATFLRGLNLVQVPTSLVGMVDASIGGKTAVDHPRAKNLIGAFYQPRLVVADVEMLTTLPQRELVSGWAEVVKHGLILDAEFFGFLEEHVDRLLKLEAEATTQAVRWSAVIKARIVSEDEKEKGRRTLLNYGHTIAHGLEAATGYRRFLHGEAVAIGMMGAAMISHDLGLLPLEAVERQRALLERFGLPTWRFGVGIAPVVQAMELDKKIREKAIRWVLLESIGKAVIRDDVSPEHVMAVLGRLV